MKNLKGMGYGTYGTINSRLDFGVIQIHFVV